MLRFQTAGESHGQALVAIVSGLPAGLRVDFDFINGELKRRQGGYGRGGRMKIESDTAQFLSGVRHGQTIGSPSTDAARRFCVEKPTGRPLARSSRTSTQSFSSRSRSNPRREVPQKVSSSSA